MSEQAFYQRWWNNTTGWMGNTLQGAQDSLHGTRQGIGDWVHDISGHRITAQQTKDALPYVAAGAVGAGALYLNEPLGKMGKTVFSGVKYVVTGGGGKNKEGFLEKIPVLGYGFKGLGWVADKAGDWSGYILGGAATLLTFNLFYNRERQPGETASSGTGAVAMPMVTIPMIAGTVQTQAPLSPANPPASPGNPLPPGLPNNYSAIYAQRAEHLANHQFALSNSLQPWLHYHNQVFENNLDFAVGCLLWNGSHGLSLSPEQTTAVAARATTSSIQPNARQRLIDELMSMGLAPTEAASMVPGAPPLPIASPGYPNLPAPLVQFATQFQNFYGNDMIKVNDGSGTQVGKNFADMSLTQKKEFLDGALDFAKERYRSIWNGTVVGPHDSGFMGSGAFCGSLPVVPVSGWPSQSWLGQNAPRLNWMCPGTSTLRWWTAPNNGRNFNYRDEFHFLSGLNQDQHMSVSGTFTPLAPTYDTFHTPHIGSHLHTLHDSLHNDVFPAIEQYQGWLNQQIGHNHENLQPYIQNIHSSQTRLRILQEHHIALTTPFVPGNNATQEITAVDMRNPTLGNNSPRLMLKGTYNHTTRIFSVTHIRLTPTSDYTPLGEPITIDMTPPASPTAALAATAGMNALKARIDQLRTQGVAQNTGMATQGLSTAMTNVNDGEILSSPTTPMTHQSSPFSFLPAAQHNHSYMHA